MKFQKWENFVPRETNFFCSTWNYFWDFNSRRILSPRPWGRVKDCSRDRTNSFCSQTFLFSSQSARCCGPKRKIQRRTLGSIHCMIFSGGATARITIVSTEENSLRFKNSSPRPLKKRLFFKPRDPANSSTAFIFFPTLSRN